MSEPNPSKKLRATDVESRRVSELAPAIGPVAINGIAPASERADAQGASADNDGARPGSNPVRSVKRPGEVDPHLDDRTREGRRDIAQLFVFLCFLAIGLSFFGLRRSAMHFGASLTAAGSCAFGALAMAERAGKRLPRWQRLLAFGLSAVGTGVVIGAIVSKLLR